MRQAYFIVGLILGLAIAVFALQNTMAVEVRFLAWQVAGSLAVVVLGSAAAGALVVFLFGIPEIVTARWRIRSLERRLEGEGRAAGGPTPTRGGEPGTPRGPTGVGV
jgi:putative membrane protein